MASVHKKKNSQGKVSPFWMMKYRAEDGRVVMRSTKQTDKKKAKELAVDTERMAAKARAGELTKAVILKNLGEMLERTTGEKLKVKSVDEFFKEFLEAKEKTGTAASTLTRYRPVINGFLDSLPALRRKASIGSITPTEVENFRNKELESGKSPSTCDFALKVLSSVLGSAQRKLLALTNPAQAVEPLNGISEERLPFTADQVKKLLAKAEDEWKGMILFGYHAGIRLNDVANLQWQNIDLKLGTVTFREQKTARRKGKDTTIVLHADVLEWLKTQPAGVGAAPLFPSLAGKTSGSAGGLSTAFNAIMKKAKIAVPEGEKATGKGRTFRKLGFHSLRHSMISNLANAEVSSDVRQAMAGHSSEEVHRRYVHLETETQRSAVEKVGSVL